MKPTIVKPNQNFTDISINVSNNALGFENELYTRLGKDKVLKSSKNQLNVNIIENSVKYTKYKKKVYVKNDIFTYKICHVNTHYFTADLEYIKNSKLVAKELIKTTTADDSCDDYMFEDYKAYTIQKTIGKIIEIINKN